MRDDGLTRPHWVERQFLRPDDFSTAQKYHLINRWRHNIGLHSWGIAQGLDLQTGEEGMILQPGLAIDGYGRELVLEQPRGIGAAEFDDLGTDELHVWIVYDVLGTEAAIGYTDCQDESGASSSGTRWTEQPAIQITDGTADVDPRDTLSGVPRRDIPFPPHREFPVDGEPWPVFLGALSRRGTGTNVTYEIDGSQRPYVGLIGRAICHPAQQAQVELGSETTPEVRFAISTFDSAKGQPVPRIALVSLGPSGGVEETRLVLQEDVIVEGDVTIERGTLWLKDSQQCDPQFSRPWQIYRCVEHSNGNTENVLRVEFGAGSDDRFEVGRWNGEAGKFQPCLTIERDCTVTIGGDLIVEGRAIVAEAIENAAFSPEAASALDVTQATSMFTFLQSLASGAVVEFVKLLTELNSGIALQVLLGLQRELLTDLEPGDPGTVEEFAAQLASLGPAIALKIMLELLEPLAKDIDVDEFVTRLVNGDADIARNVMLKTLHKLAPTIEVDGFVDELVAIDPALARDVMLETLRKLAPTITVEPFVTQLMALDPDLARDLVLETLRQLAATLDVRAFVTKLIGADPNLALKLRDELVRQIP